MDAAAVASEYYRVLDEGEYGALADLLAPGFVQERPDLTLEGRDRFVRFVREERPEVDTTHAVDAVYAPESPAEGADDGDGRSADESARQRDGQRREVVVRGRLHTADGDLLVRFVDVFAVGDDGVERLDTYTR